MDAATSAATTNGANSSSSSGNTLLHQQLIYKAQQLRAAGATEANNPQYAQIVATLRALSQPQSLPQLHQQTPQSLFSPEQRDTLRNQIHAYKLLASNSPIPPALRVALFGHESSPTPSESARDESEDGVLCIDPIQIIQEREQRIRDRIAHRIRQLESLPANLSNAYTSPTQESSLKLRALIELKSLKLVEKQQQLRESLFLGMQNHTTLLTSIDRNMYRRVRKFTYREARQTEQVEAEKRGEREKREKMRLSEYLSAIANCSREILAYGKSNAQRLQKLGALVQKQHAVIEKEEQKRAERLAKERMRALQENDEAAYVKLLDEAKDGRIMQILNKTNSYLANLASAVVTQKEQISGDAIYLDPESVVVDNDSGDAVDYYAVAHRIKEKVEKQSGLLIGGQLKEYQIKGLEWMISLYNNRLNGILADEMGLGKTIQTISLITYLIEKKRQMGPFLVIVPLSTVTNWVHEFDKWAPSVVKLVFKGGPDERRRTAAQIRSGNFQVCITTYEYIIREKAVLSKIKWLYMIIDEGHRMKNSQSKLSITLMQFYSTRYRVILTGTPLQNNLPELWNLLNFILPKIFNSVKSFDEWFSSPFGGANSGVQMELNEEEQLLMIKSLHKVLRPFLLRRLKKDVEKELPEKVEVIIKCPMSALQRKITERVRHLRSVGPFDQTKLSGSKALNNLMMQFRKICNHPFVFPEVEQLVLPHETMTTDMIYRVSGKFELLDRILPKFFRTGHRVLMFFQMTQIMTIAEDFLRYRGMKFLRLDGGVKGEDREGLLTAFNAPNSEYDIFILSTRAGGLGLNLQTADTVIIFDSDWNPFQDLQAQDRAYRIGQKKAVKVFRLITTNSIEEHILSKAQEKLNLDGKVIQAGKFDQKTSEKEREELLRVLLADDKGEEKAETDDGEEEEKSDEQLNEDLARHPEEIEIFAQMDRERIESEMAMHDGNPPSRLISEAELPDCYRIDFSKLKQADRDDLLSIKPRDRKAVHYGDVLTEEQFMMAADSGNLNEAIAAKLEEKARRAARKATGQPDEGNAGSDAGEDDGQGPFDDFDDDDDGDAPRTRRTAAKSSGAVSSSSNKRRGKKSKAEMLASDSISSADRDLITNIGHACLSAIREATVADDDGIVYNRCAVFEDLPSKRSYKDYYDLITNPICLTQIQKKINGMRYLTIEEMKADFALMFSNARTYNVEGSTVHEDANELERIFNETFALHTDEGNRTSQKHTREDGETENTDYPAFDGSFSETPSRRPAKRVKEDSDEDD